MKRLYRYYKQNWETGWETSFEINTHLDTWALPLYLYISHNYITVEILCFHFVWYNRLMPYCGDAKTMNQTI